MLETPLAHEVRAQFDATPLRPLVEYVARRLIVERFAADAAIRLAGRR